MGDKSRGLYAKFKVRRRDNKDVMPGDKHYGCDYFVLDLDHDELALPALATYARTARAEGYNLLADDLEELIKERSEENKWK